MGTPPLRDHKFNDYLFVFHATEENKSYINDNTKINNLDNQFLSIISLNTNHTPLKIQNSFDFFTPEILKPKEIETVSSQLDLMPTFIEFMVLKTEYTALGTSLLRKKEAFALVREGSLGALSLTAVILNIP